MEETRKLMLPLSREAVASLRAGDGLLLCGTLYTARDAAHQKFMELLDAGEPLPFPLAGAVIYYMGPTPAKPGAATGSAGPTTSGRMDAFTPRLLGLGLRGMIGKGPRSEAVVRAMQEAGAVYFGAVGGTGALTARCIRRAETIAFPELGPEAVQRLYIEDFPVRVLVDSQGADYYRLGREAYLRGSQGAASWLGSNQPLLQE